MTADPVIHWFRQDLRLADNRALTAAVATGGDVFPVYVLDDAAAAPRSLGCASRWWLDGSLRSLDASLVRAGSRLILRRGRTVEVLLHLAAETGAKAIYFTRAYEPTARRLEQDLKVACDNAGLVLRRYSGGLLHEPEAIRTKTGDPFRVFTPFWRAVLDRPPPNPPVAPVRAVVAPARWPKREPLDTWALAPRKPDWAGGLRMTWEPGEAGAQKRLTTLIDSLLTGYAEHRDRPDVAGTSMLSPHLHFGEISPAQCWHAVSMARDMDEASSRGAGALLREIGWRDFSAHLLHHWPHMSDQPFRPEFTAFPWDADPQRVDRNFAAWSRGLTGYPIVDAGMRQLWHTGWMHNRVRMIAASFLTKHLLIPWQSGAGWFWDTLVDADLASNAASWQWVAGSGADTAPYFRIFNPVLQGERFDPNGIYVRRFVPELARMPSKYIHAPWAAPAAVLAAAGVTLGTTYPWPVVDHAAARQQALAAYATLRVAKGGSTTPTSARRREATGPRT